MIVEIDEDSRDFATVYKKDYLEKKGEKPTKKKRLPSSTNILNELYNRYLNTRLEYQLLSENERSKDPINNLNRICAHARDTFPRLRNALPDIVLYENVIEREKKKSMKTVYQLSYSKEFDHVRKDITLSRDWVIPETVQKRAYRDPWVIATKNLIEPRKILKPRNNLEPALKEREILRITTGNSEYASTIGATEEIMVLRSLSDMKEHIGLQASLKIPEISASECSLILKQNLAFPSKIF